MGVSDPDRLEQIVWALPKELGNYDFLAANGHIVAKDSADEKTSCGWQRSGTVRQVTTRR